MQPSFSVLYVESSGGGGLVMSGSTPWNTALNAAPESAVGSSTPDANDPLRFPPPLATDGRDCPLTPGRAGEGSGRWYGELSADEKAPPTSSSVVRVVLSSLLTGPCQAAQNKQTNYIEHIPQHQIVQSRYFKGAIQWINDQKKSSTSNQYSKQNAIKPWPCTFFRKSGFIYTVVCSCACMVTFFSATTEDATIMSLLWLMLRNVFYIISLFILRCLTGSC